MTENSLIGQQIQGYNIIRKLGSGGYGTVYLGEKEDLGKKYQTAIKHISMPDAEGYEAALQDYSYDKAATQAHFEKMVEGITSEINTLLELSKRDNRYIVAYYDHDIQKKLDPLCFEIFLRMEYLTPLNRAIRRNGMKLGEVVKLGLNMCDALSLCHNNGVMHRDIKEANIFVSDNGNFKLGDFGVAKVALEATQSGSIKGTASYMAPEIYLREPYDTSVDIYSLGIVLYKLLNNQRLPFMPPAPAPFTVDDKNLAETRRLKGEVPPLPVNASDRLGEIVVKACSARNDRYARAEDMKADLQAFLKSITDKDYDSVVISPSIDTDETSDSYTENSLNSYTQTQGATVTMGAQKNSTSSGSVSSPIDQNPYASKKPKTKKKKGKVILVFIIFFFLIAAGVGGYIAYLHFTDPVNKFESAIMESNFISAAQLYQDEIKNGDSSKIAKAGQFIVNHAEEIQAKYVNTEVEYEDALTQLQEMGKLGIVSSSELQPMITTINELRTSRVAYESAQSNIEAGEWKSAISELHKVIQSDANYSVAQTQLANAIRSYKADVLSSMSDYESSDDYSGAISALRAALLVVPDDADFLSKISDYEKTISDNIDLAVAAIIQDANRIILEESDYLGALNSLRAADKQYPNRENIKNTISEIEYKYLDFVFAEIDELIAKKQYDNAVSMLNDLKSSVSDGQAISEKIDEVNGMRPIDLSQVVVIDSKEYEYHSEIFTDSFGNTYDGRHGFRAGYNGYAVFNLGANYTTFSGTIVVDQDTKSDASMQVAIYVDDKLVYSKDGITKRTGSIDFSIDVRGATKLGVNTNAGYSTYYGKLSIVNATLEK